MSRMNLKTATDEELVEAYACEAIQQGEADRPRVANRHADAIWNIARELRHRGPEVQSKLLSLLAHPNVHVRGWSSTHALAFAPERAEPVLRALAQEPGIPGLNARMTLQEWQKGTLGLP